MQSVSGMVLFYAALALFVAGADAVTPVEKVTTLLGDLKKSVEAEGVKEAATYEKFSCFCKDTTTDKSKSITEAQDTIDTTSADIGAKTATKKEKITKHGQEQQKVEETSIKLQEATAAYGKDKAAYQATSNDLTKAIASIRRALKSLKDSKGAALLSVGAKSDVRDVLDLADALDLIKAAKQETVVTFLQRVDPNDPAYKFHSAKIVEIIESLQKDFKDKKESLQKEWEKTDTSFKAEKKDMEGKIETAKKAVKTLSGEIDKLSSDIAKKRDELMGAQSTLEDDSAYMKDLTSRCEAKANDWDQRSKMRNDEVAALAKALQILGDRVKDADKVNKRALLLAKAVVAPAAAAASSKPAAAPKVEATKPAAAVVKTKDQRAKSFLAKVSMIQLLSAKREQSAVDMLRHEGARLNSDMLSSLASQIQADPFTKIKKLIQGLIERLLNEAKNEATKKGFCDTELGKSHSTRKSRYADINKLDAEVAELEAHKDSLGTEIDELTTSVGTLEKALNTSTALRKDEKTENADTLKTAQEGVAAVGEALVVLKDFYKSAAKAALVQVSASPVDEDTAGAGFDGSYKGSQESSRAILGLLETIKSDFERTVRNTEAEEAKAHEEFVQFERASKADIAGKKTKTALDTQDLDSTKSAIAEGMKDLKTATNLLDVALKNIEELKPTCIDTGMSYAERIQKREDEMAALKKALCMLDSEKVEAQCK